MTQSEGLPLSRLDRICGENKLVQKIAGQVRMNIENQRLVYLLRCVFEETQDGAIALWHVRDVLSEECYRLKHRSIGGHYNEMEVLAYVSS